MSSELHNSGDDEAEAKKPSTQILRHELKEARAALDRSLSRLLVSGLSAGMDLGFSLFLIAVLLTLTESELPKPIVELLAANMYSFGFVLVVIGRSELFTEQTSLAILPLLNGVTTVRKVARLWAAVYVTNIIGGAIFAAIVVVVGPSLKIIDPHIFGTIARRVVAHEWWVILLSGILAGWLMGLLSWLVAASRDTISQIVFVWLITAAIGLSHLHHTVAGTVEVLASVFSSTGATMADFWHFLVWTTLGNAIGGPLFVALLKYGPAKPSRRGHEP